MRNAKLRYRKVICRRYRVTTVDYLRQIRVLNDKINNRLVEIEQTKQLMCSISAISYEERVQTTPNFDRIGTALCKIEQMEDKLNKLIDVYVDKKMDIIEQIESLENATHREILSLRYIEGKKIKEIENIMHYSYRNVQRHHNKAIMKFETKYGNLYLED